MSQSIRNVLGSTPALNSNEACVSEPVGRDWFKFMVSDEAFEIANEIMNVYPLGPLISEDEIIIAFKMLAVLK